MGRDDAPGRRGAGRLPFRAAVLSDDGVVVSQTRNFCRSAPGSAWFEERALRAEANQMQMTMRIVGAITTRTIRFAGGYYEDRRPPRATGARLVKERMTNTSGGSRKVLSRTRKERTGGSSARSHVRRSIGVQVIEGLR